MLYDARPAGIDACFFGLLFYVVFDWVLGNHSHLYTFVKTSLSLSLSLSLVLFLLQEYLFIQLEVYQCVYLDATSILRIE